MKYIKQLLIILIISCIGELLNFFIPLPIPGSIYGMILLFILLCCGVIKISQIKETGDFLIDIMPILFVPSAVGIISQLDQLKSIWIQIIIITIVTTFLVMGITGLVTQAVIRMKRGKNKK
ncbi:MAG: CidA/LrgA family protein [Ruminococcus sp.]|nr:CidA/LrgA family protein [Ruminococcus sp.]